MHAEPQGPEYVLGRSEMESQRLIEQSDILHDATERVLRNVGLAPGMRVLDVGCGTGDVSLLMADIVGPSGAVVGIDIDPGVLEIARRRCGERNLRSVSFVEQSIESLAFEESFDAVVGRLVLFYQADPVAAIRRTATTVRSGGIVVFHEVDMTVGLRSSPRVALWQRCSEWITETFRRGGVHIDMGMQLYTSFLDAGLAGPEICHDTWVGGGRGLPHYQYFSTMVRSLLPRMEAFGIVTADEVQIDTLAERLEHDVVAARAQIVGFGMFGAWTRKS